MMDAATLNRIREALGSADPALRAECADALAMSGDVRGLCRALQSRDRYLRLRAVKGLAGLPGEGITWRLARMVHDTDTEVRLAVATALAQRGGWFATRVLRHLAADEHAAVRYAALAELARRDPQWTAARLREVALTDPQAWLRDAAAALQRQRVTKRSCDCGHPDAPPLEGSECTCG
jgi:HEAT repeat protein